MSVPFLLFPLLSPAASAASPAVAGPPDLAEVVVSATRANGGIDARLVGGAVTTIGPDELRDRQVRTLSDVLRDVPGVAVSRAGPAGAVTQVRLRGTEANHALVLVDGMEATDPYFGEFDFALLHPDEIARVEVLRGPQSALFGSDAVGGVIHYITLDGREAPGATLRVEGGAFGTFDTAARLAGAGDALDYAVTAAVQRGDGVPTSRFGTRATGYDNRTLSARLGWQATDALRLRGVVRASRNGHEYNSQDFDWTSPTYGYVVDTTDRSRNRSLQALVAAELGAPGDRWQQSLTLQALDARREAFDASGRNDASLGGRLKASWVASVALGGGSASHRVTFATDAEREFFRNDGSYATPAQSVSHRVDNIGLVGQYDVALGERLGFGAALRFDGNDRFADVTTFRVQGSWLAAPATRLRAAMGTGIKNPNSTELFGFDPETFVGNPALRPERSRSWEFGVEQSLAGGAATLAATYSDGRLEEEIFTRYSPTFVASPDNRTTRSSRRALELQGRAQLPYGLRVDATFSFLDAMEAGAEEVRRPPRSGSLNLGWQSADARRGLNLTWRYNGRFDDFNFTNDGPPRVRLGSYQLVQLAGRWRVSDAVEAFGRVENLLGERYEDVWTYRTPGRGWFVGLRSRL